MAEENSVAEPVVDDISESRSESPVAEAPGNNAASEFIAEITGKEVIVKLTSSIEYHGLLQAVDGFMNITLQNTKEVYDGKLVSEFGDVFLRGSMVAYIAAA